MTKAEQKQFTRELITNVTGNVLRALPRVPDNWDGHELRELIAQHFVRCSWTLHEKQNRARLRAFKNECLTRNLV